MLDYLNNMRFENITHILSMPMDKCMFPVKFCKKGTSSYIFWNILKFLKAKVIRRKIKLLSHMHRQMYFKYLLLEND